jgi:hypothetical protein
MAKETEKGIGVDSQGNPVIDPTRNVLDLVEAAVKRIDDVFAVQISKIEALAELRAQHVKEVAEIREKHNSELNNKEASRLDSIRQIDQSNQTAQAKVALDAIQANAKQVTDLATSVASSIATTFDGLAKRTAALELSSAEGIGKTRVKDPQIEMFINKVDSLLTSRSEKQGSSDQSKAIYGYVVGIIGIGIAIVSFVMGVMGQ